MNKKIIGLLLIFIFLITLSNVTCEEIFVIMKNPSKTKTVSKNIEKTSEALSKKYPNNVNIKKLKVVRVLIKNSNYSSIYHSQLNFKGKNMKIYYDKNYRKIDVCKKIHINKNSKCFKNKKIIKVESENGINWINHSRTQSNYKGIFYIYKTRSGLVVVNELSIENYLAGVIASEIGIDSPIEALKAQGLCGKNFLYSYKKKKYKKYNCILDDSTDCQVYNKINPNKKCYEAAQKIKDEIMLYKEKIVKAYYFSTSYGCTTDYKIWNDKEEKYLTGICNIEGKNLNQFKNENEFKTIIKSYPKSIESKYDFYRWNIYLSKKQLYYTIGNETNENIGNIKNIKVTRRGIGGIASQILIIGSKGKIVMTNEYKIRRALCSIYGKINLNNKKTTNMNMLPSPFIYIEPVGNKGFKIYGGGFGHGCGLSQNGAIEMAKEKKKYKEILKYYYKDIDIKKQIS